MAEKPVGARTLGRLLALSDRSVRDLAERGIIERSEPGRYLVSQAVPAYVRHLRQVAAGRSADDTEDLNLAKERALLAREQREAQALKNQVTRQEVLPRKEVFDRWAAILRNVSARLRSVPSRVRQQRPHFTVDDVELIDREIRDALTEAADVA